MVSPRFNVLLPEPQALWHRQAVGLLEPRGIHTISARSGREALELIEHREIHAAVLDQTMPQLSGLQVVKLLRETENPPPAILLANDLTTHLLHEALGMKVFSVLAKPVDLTQLLDALARLLRRRYEGKWPGTP